MTPFQQRIETAIGIPLKWLPEAEVHCIQPLVPEKPFLLLEELLDRAGVKSSRLFRATKEDKKAMECIEGGERVRFALPTRQEFSAISTKLLDDAIAANHAAKEMPE